MSWIDGLHARLRMLFRRSAVERELEDELAFHVERETERNLSERLDAAAARRLTRVRFGGGDRFREEARDAWSAPPFNGLGQDIRRAGRRLAAKPGFALVALTTLALGIGANTAVFSLVKSVLMAPLPYADADRLVMVWRPSGSQADDTWLSAREILEYAAASRTMEDVAGFTLFDANLTEGEEPERVRGAAMTASVFDALGIGPQHGRSFGPSEDAPGADDVVVLAHSLWQRRFGGAADLVGRDVRVNGRLRTVVGVMPPEFRLPLDFRDERPTELWVPAAIDRTAELPWGSRDYYLLARLADGVSARSANDELERIHTGWEAAGYINNTDGRLDRAAIPFADFLLGGVRSPLLILFGAVGFILVIACVNVANLLLARADARRREVATQAALGASRLRIARQLLVESGVLAAGGAALGLLLAYAGVQAILALAPVNVVRTRGVAVDGGVLAFTTVLAFATTLLAGLVPALELSRVRLASTMASSRGDIAPVRRVVRRTLVPLETALAVMLVIGAVLLARSFAGLRSIDLGFDAGEAVTLRLQLPQAGYEDPVRAVRFFEEVVERAARLPGVEAAGAARILPLTRTIGDWSITVEHRPVRPNENPNGDWQIVTPGYFEAMRIPLVAGRYPTTADGVDSPPVALVNETMAARYWPGESALGRRFHLGNADQPWIEIIGVTRNVRHNAVLEDARAEMFLPHAQWSGVRGGGSAQLGMSLVVRTRTDPLALVPALREQVRALDPLLPISDVRTYRQITAAALAQPRFTTALLVVFAGLALLLAALGLYGVISYVAGRRTNEMGIRMALGARRSEVARLVVGEGLALALVGIGLGVVGALWLTRYLTGMLYGVRPADPLTFVAVPAVLLVVAAAAAYVPARRAARVSPVSALRTE